jgi:integrase
MPLTELEVKKAKPKPKDYALADEKGMRLLVRVSGTKTWQLRYRRPADNKADVFTLGTYPELTLKEARAKRDDARNLLDEGIDPKKHKRAKRAENAAKGITFAEIAAEWFDTVKPNWSPTHTVRTINLLNNHLKPFIGDRPISEITPPELLSVLKKMQVKGILDSAQRAKQTAGQIFRYAIQTGRLSTDPSRDLAGALTPPKTKSFAALTDPKDVAKLLVAIESYEGTPTVKGALKLSALLFQRPGEIRTMKWEQIDWDAAEWRYTVSKTNTPHIVPLAKQSLAILVALQELNFKSEFVFPSARGASRPLSENGVRVALRTMGYTNEQMTAHGFRAMARTVLDEVLGFLPELIEHQMAHTP